MKSFHRYIFLILLVLISCVEEDILSTSTISCTIANSPAATSNSKSALFRALIDEYSAKGLPGISLRIEDASGVFLGSSGMADIKEGVQMSPCHVSKIASVTKLMLASLIFRLDELGQIDMDSKLSAYLSEDQIRNVANADKVTLRDLLRHSAGTYEVISDTGFYLQILNDPTRHWTAEELLKYVRGKPAEFEPNTSRGYSNTNYLLLQMAVEAAVGEKTVDLFHQLIFDPLGMNDTYYHWHDELPAHGVCQGYYDLYQTGDIMNLSDWNTGSGNGYGGVYSTVIDMDLFMQALLVDKTLLSQGSLDEMLVFDETIIESRKYLGTGIFKDFIDISAGSYAYGHRGRDLAYSADLFYFPQESTVMSLIVNYGTDSESKLRPVFLDFRDKLAMIIMQ